MPEADLGEKLLAAARMGVLPEVHELLEAGAPIDHASDKGRTALMVCGTAGMATLLLVAELHQEHRPYTRLGAAEQAALARLLLSPPKIRLKEITIHQKLLQKLSH